MAALVCDICGGKLIMGAGGVATCESCGMEHSANRMKEKVQEIKGVVRVDNSHMVENYLEMANRAYASSNNAEAEQYCNKIIEIDPGNYQALMLKGKAAGWQSTLKNSRFDEAVNCFSMAIANAPDEEKDDYISETKDQISKLSSALMSLQADRFAKWPDDDEAAGLINVVAVALQAIVQFIKTVGVQFDKNELMARLATQINNAVMDAWNNKIVPEYKNDSDGHPDDYAFRKFIDRAGRCYDILRRTFDLYDEADENDIRRYENCIAIIEAMNNSCSWESVYFAERTHWRRKLYLTDESKKDNQKMIDKCRTKISNVRASIATKRAAEKREKERIAREKAQKRLDAYWAEHTDEKASLEAEKKELTSQISALKASYDEQVAALRKEIADIPGKEEINNIEGRIEKLTEEKSELGIFKGKAKKALQEQIDQANAEKKKVQERMEAAEKEIKDRIVSAEAEFRKKRLPLQVRVDTITDELTKPR